MTSEKPPAFRVVQTNPAIGDRGLIHVYGADPAAPRPYVEQESSTTVAADPIVRYMSRAQLEKSIERTRKLMQEAAKKLDFIEAAQYRDEVLKMEELGNAIQLDMVKSIQ